MLLTMIATVTKTTVIRRTAPSPLPRSKRSQALPMKVKTSSPHPHPLLTTYRSLKHHQKLKAMKHLKVQLG